MPKHEPISIEFIDPNTPEEFKQLLRQIIIHKLNSIRTSENRG